MPGLSFYERGNLHDNLVLFTRNHLENPQVIIKRNGSAWLLLQIEWWDLSTLLWWLLTPSYKREKYIVHFESGIKVNCYGVCLSERCWDVPK